MSYIYDLTDTWNAAGTTFNAIKMNVTNTASAAGSRLITCQVGGVEKFSVDKNGVAYFASAIGAAYGGTGQTSYTVGDILYASGTTTLSKLAGVATGNALISGGVGSAPSYGKIGLTTHVSGTLAVANGGTGATTAATARTNLGATTVGGNLFTLTNPSAITFPRFNADNTVSALDAATFRTAIGAGTSSTTGTVTSVGGTGTVSGLTLTGTVTTSGSLTLGGTLSVTPSNFASQTANTFLAAPNGVAGVPAFRSIVAADVPTLNQNTTGTASNVTGTVAVANGGTGATTAATARTNLGATTVGGNLFTLTNPSAITFPRFNADNTVSALDAATFRTAIGAGTGSGTVTSVALSGGTTGLTVSGSPITTSGTITLAGTLAVANGGTGATTAATARTNLGAAASGANTDITALDQDVTITATGTIAADTIGFRGLPQNSQTASYTLALADAGKHISITTGGVVIPANASVAFPVGTTIVIFNNSASSQTISITTDTLRQAGTANTGSRTLAQYGLATCVKVASTTWVISGAGVS